MQDALCIKSVGLFRIFQEKLNYTNAITKCQDVGGDLADITSEIRTNGIASLLKDNLADWFKIAYVGLDDIKRERHFENPMGEPLSCFKYRAWAPGHPRNKQKTDDCVTVDSESVWRVIDCKQNLSFVCELYPTGPPKRVSLQNITTCSEIEDRGEVMLNVKSFDDFLKLILQVNEEHVVRSRRNVNAYRRKKTVLWLLIVVKIYRYLYLQQNKYCICGLTRVNLLNKLLFSFLPPNI